MSDIVDMEDNLKHCGRNFCPFVPDCDCNTCQFNKKQDGLLLAEIKAIIHKRIRRDYDDYPVGFEEYGCAEEIIAKAKQQVYSEISSRIANIEIHTEDASDFRSRVVNMAIGLGKQEKSETNANK